MTYLDTDNEEFLRETDTFRAFIHAGLVGEIPETLSARIASSMLHLTLEHQEAMALLLRRRLEGAAFALLRPCLETATRALWLVIFGEEEDRKRFSEGKNPFPRFREMIGSIADVADDSEMRNIAEHWQSLCGLTHGGVEQIGRRKSPDGAIAPNFTPWEKWQLIRMSTHIIFALAILTGDTIGRAGFSEALIPEWRRIFGKYGSDG